MVKSNNIFMSASELAEKVISHPNGGVDALVSLTDAQEEEWLEFKASLMPLPDEHEENVKHAKARRAWHVAKAVIALANTQGGAVILGVNDNGKPVGLSCSDPAGVLLKEGWEAFLRKVIDAAIRAEKGWKFGNDGEHWQVSPSLFQNIISYKKGFLEGQQVLVILVNPVPQGEDLIEVEQYPLKREILLVRDSSIGRISDLWRGEDKKQYRRDRVVAIPKYYLLWNKFIQQMTPSSSIEEDKIEQSCFIMKFSFIGLDFQLNTKALPEINPVSFVFEYVSQPLTYGMFALLLKGYPAYRMLLPTEIESSNPIKPISDRWRDCGDVAQQVLRKKFDNYLSSYRDQLSNSCSNCSEYSCWNMATSSSAKNKIYISLQEDGEIIRAIISSETISVSS